MPYENTPTNLRLFIVKVKEFANRIYDMSNSNQKLMMTTAERIRQRRKQLNLSQEVLAGLAGIDQTQISKYELGRNDPGADALAAIAQALDTTTDWLVGLTDNPDRPLRGQGDLNSEEQELIKIYRSKSPEKRHQITEIVKVV
jgi:transcriptional regulator with XRE-family HTH domain